MPYIPYTDEQKQLANSIDLPMFLRMRGEKLIPVGREYKLIYNDISGKHDSITVSGSQWYDHKNQIGGGPIKLMREHYGMNFQEAMQTLLGHRALPVPQTAVPVMAREKKEFALPEPNDNMHRVYAYLIKQRYIAPEIISHFAKQHLIFEDKAHHNAVFVGVDEDGVPRQAHLRSTNSYGKAFRITAEGSDTKYSFAHFGKSEKLFVFEAPIDMLSYLTMNPQNWQKHSYIAMNGVYENAVLTALKGHSNLSEIVICTDNDEGGTDAADRLTDILRERGYDHISGKTLCFKDWNECLKAKNGAEALPAVPHRRKEIYYEKVSDLQYFKCNPERLSDRISKTFHNKQYRYSAEYALAASAFFIGRNNEKSMFDKLKLKLSDEYRAYADKGKMLAKQDDLKSAYQAVMRDLRQTARTREQLIQTAKLLFRLADCAVRIEVEDALNAPVQEQNEKMDIAHEIEPYMEFG